MCYAILILRYRNGVTKDDKPIACDSEADLATKKRDAQGRSEAVRIDVYIHNPHDSVELVAEWRPRSTITKVDQPSSRPVDVLPSMPPSAAQGSEES